MNAKEEAEKLLPCDGRLRAQSDYSKCACNYRAVVAAALEARDKEIVRLKEEIVQLEGEIAYYKTIRISY